MIQALRAKWVALDTWRKDSEARRRAREAETDDAVGEAIVAMLVFSFAIACLVIFLAVFLWSIRFLFAG